MGKLGPEVIVALEKVSIYGAKMPIAVTAKPASIGNFIIYCHHWMDGQPTAG
jgi:hypothetical protein